MKQPRGSNTEQSQGTPERLKYWVSTTVKGQRGVLTQALGDVVELVNV